MKRAARTLRFVVHPCVTHEERGASEEKLHPNNNDFYLPFAFSRGGRRAGVLADAHPGERAACFQLAGARGRHVLLVVAVVVPHPVNILQNSQRQ